MNLTAQQREAHRRWARRWRLAVVAVCTLILCSCRSPIAQRRAQPSVEPIGPSLAQRAEAVPAPPGEPDEAGEPLPLGEPIAAEPRVSLPLDPLNLPHPWQPRGPWQPPGIVGPWPADEYLHDGGDEIPWARVNDAWEIRGLEQGDTVAHYENLEGQRFVEPSNRVDIYAPRFASVRAVFGAEGHEHVAQAGGVYLPQGAKGQRDVQGAVARTRDLPATRQTSSLPIRGLVSRRHDGAVSRRHGPIEFKDDHNLPLENLSLLRRGVLEKGEEPYLAQAAEAARVWSVENEVEVYISDRAAQATSGTQTAQVFYTVEGRKGAKLRLVKAASTQLAEPGDEIDFVLRFDNVGQEVLGNVVIVDNLTARLEYVPDTQQSSVEAPFSVEQNEGGSLVLRWEIEEPLQPGEGGVLKFRCRVR